MAHLGDLAGYWSFRTSSEWSPADILPVSVDADVDVDFAAPPADIGLQTVHFPPKSLAASEPTTGTEAISTTTLFRALAEADYNEVLGTRGADTLKGTSKRDSIQGFRGDDNLFGFDRGDILAGGLGSDTLRGGRGNDVLKGGNGNDILSGGTGADTLFGGGGSDILNGGDGADTLNGGQGRDSLKGELGNDVLDGGGKGDTLSGGIGNDLLKGGGGNDRLSGGKNNDILIGGAGVDRLIGGAGSDRFVINAGATAIDVLDDFSRSDRDVINLGKVLPPGTDADEHGAFVKLVASGADAYLRFSETGETGSFKRVALIKNGADLDVADLLERGQLVLGSPDAPNAAPEPKDDTGFTMTAGEELQIPVSDLLANDSDPDGDTLTLTKVVGARLEASNVIVSASDAGTKTFTYTVADPDGATASAKVSVAVKNPPPIPDDLSFADHDRAVVVDLASGSWADAARILLLGDSITDGYRLPGGYRPYLWETLTQSTNAWVDFVGGYDNNPGAGFHDPDHQGLSGIKASTVLGDINQIARASPSDIALIMLGTNDVLREADAGDDVPGELLDILERLHAANPNGIFLVAELLPISDATKWGTVNYRATEINDALPGIISQAQSKGINAFLVDTSKMTLGDMSDGIHPSSGGQRKLAGIWSDAISSNVTVSAGTLEGDRKSVSNDVTDLVGSAFGDRLLGDDRGNDLRGAGGNDWIEGRAGNDILRGGAGIDQFVFGDKDGRDTIKDYAAGSDLVYLRTGSSADYSTSNSNGDTVITFGNTRVTVENTLSDQISIELINSFDV